MAAGSAAVTFHRQQDDHEEQKHCAEEQGEDNIAPGDFSEQVTAKATRDRGCHRGQKQGNFCSELQEQEKIIVPPAIYTAPVYL